MSINSEHLLFGLHTTPIEDFKENVKFCNYLYANMKVHRWIALCPKSPSARGFVASLPVHLLFRYV